MLRSRACEALRGAVSMSNLVMAAHTHIQSSKDLFAFTACFGKRAKSSRNAATEPQFVDGTTGQSQHPRGRELARLRYTTGRGASFCATSSMWLRRL
jgi:hypothetical protein